MTKPLNLGGIIGQVDHALGIIRQCDEVTAAPGSDLRAAVMDALRSASNDLEECSWLLGQTYWALKHEPGES